MHSLEKAFLRVSLIFQADDADDDADDEADDDSDDRKDSKDDATTGVDDDVKVSLFMLTELIFSLILALICWFRSPFMFWQDELWREWC